MANNDAFEKALDLMIEEAVAIVNENEGKSIESEPKREFSAEHNKKMKNIFRQLQREERKKNIVQYAKRAACICLVALVAASISIFSVEAWRKNVINFFYDKDAPNSKYNFNELGGTTYQDANISLAYLPWGFEVTRNTVSEHMFILLFEKEDLYFTVSVIESGGQGSLDTENATVSKIDIDNCEAILVEKDDANQILWQDGEHEFHVAGNINSSEIIKIAKNLKKN